MKKSSLFMYWYSRLPPQWLPGLEYILLPIPPKTPDISLTHPGDERGSFKLDIDKKWTICKINDSLKLLLAFNA